MSESLESNPGSKTAERSAYLFMSDMITVSAFWMGDDLTMTKLSFCAGPLLFCEAMMLAGVSMINYVGRERVGIKGLKYVIL